MQAERKNKCKTCHGNGWILYKASGPDISRLYGFGTEVDCARPCPYRTGNNAIIRTGEEEI